MTNSPSPAGGSFSAASPIRNFPSAERDAATAEWIACWNTSTAANMPNAVSAKAADRTAAAQDAVADLMRVAGVYRRRVAIRDSRAGRAIARLAEARAGLRAAGDVGASELLEDEPLLVVGNAGPVVGD